MEIINNILNYKFIFIGLLALLLLIVILIIILKPKKVKPIETTIDDEVDSKTDIQQVIAALEDNTERRPMTTFEEEQEANAIISYQELVQAVNQKKAHLEKDIPKNLESELPNEIEEEPTQPKFKNSEFISPIFGKDSNNDNFLKELKDFRNNL